MTLLGTGFRRVLLLAIIAMCVILVALNIILNIKLRSVIPGFIERYSAESPYEIEVGKTNLDPLFRVKFDEVSITDPSAEINTVLKVNRVTVKPHILASLLSRKIHMGEIVINTPVAQSNQENVNNLIDFIDKLRGGEQEESKVELGSFKILHGDFHISPELNISVPRLQIEISDGLESGRQIDFDGKFSLMQNDLASSGSINIAQDKTKGGFELRIDKIDTSSFSSLSGGSKELKAVANVNIVVSDLISLDGDLTIDSQSGIFKEKSFADAVYELQYNKANDQATVTKLDIRVHDLVAGSFTGEIKKVIKETVFNLSGELKSLDLRDTIVRILGDDNGILSGELKTEQLKITGSREKNDIYLNVDTNLNEFRYRSEGENGPKVEKLDCDLKFNQKLNTASGFPLSASGDCTAGEFYWDKTGIVNDIKTRVKLDSGNKWLDSTITLSIISSSFMDGKAYGTLNFFLSQGVSGGISKISGDINGNNLNLEKTPKAIIPANIAGDATSASATFEGGSGNYEAYILLAANNFLLKSNKAREFRVLSLQTLSPVNLKYKSLDVKDGNSENTTDDEIHISGGQLSYRNLSFEEYQIDKGMVKSLDFLLELGKDRWSLDMSSEGSDFTILGYDVSLKKFNESLKIENSGREGFKGSIQGRNGKYKSTEFPELSWNYNFINDRIIVSDVSAQISTIGQFKTDNLYINVGNDIGGYTYNVDFSDATFTGFEEKLKSEGIRGEFIINKPGTTKYDWQGKVNIKKTLIASAVVENISNSITPAPGGINLEDINGEFLNGDITGNIKIDTTTSPSGIVTNLKLLNATAESGGTSIKLSETNLNFSGTLPSSSLPEGEGNLELKNIILENEGAQSKLNTRLKTRTFAETLYIEQGFIEDSVTKKISFTGKMDNSLNENRSLNLKFPEVAISDAMGMLSPFIPTDFRHFTSKGYVGLELLFHNLFYPEGRWGGKLNLRNSSLSGEYGGAILSVNDINGTITIKDKVSSENPLADVMGNKLKLSKSIFQKFLTTFNATNLEEENLDFLSIKEIEYGILKFDNVECALEVDTQKANLRRIISKLFRGSVDGAGLIRFDRDGVKYNFSLLFNELSLESFSEKVSPNQEYITGRLNGLLWLRGVGAKLDTIDGPFRFWSKRSGKEQRKIGRALLNQLGARERLILGSTRSYDNGNISGYIYKGLITFREFEITNSILGIKNLSIQADPIQNSITISHLVSVIRELARRSETGGPRIETN